MERSLSLEDCDTGKNTHAQGTISEDASFNDGKKTTIYPILQR
jgi:hypothetical protein